MSETLYIILGIILLVFAISDFFYTTLSGSGAAFFSRFIAVTTHKIFRGIAKKLGRNVYDISGIIINLMLLSGWLILIWLGLFFIFSSDPGAIVNSEGRSATAMERLYFTGYTLSTLGLGNFKPTSPVFEFLTSIFSFFGFVFFTTSMTYLISMSSAMVNKRTLSLSIRNLGKNPEEIVEKLHSMDKFYCFQILSSIQNMIDRHSVNLQAYPIVHFYNSSDVNSSFSINLATLEEAINIMTFRGRDNKHIQEISTLRNSLIQFYNHLEDKYPHLIQKNNNYRINRQNLLDINKPGVEKIDNDADVQHRRQLLVGLLKSENFDWSDVYTSR